MRSKGIVRVAAVTALFWAGAGLGPPWAEEAEAPPCHQAPQQTRYSRTEATYRLPDVTLLDQEGRSVSLREVLERPGPVAVDFVFTTCTTICPVMTATFSKMRRELESDGTPPHLVSISIDPEYDRPERLREYAAKFRTGPDWTFLTGSRDDVKTALSALDAWVENKMTHKALYLFRAPDRESWVRIEGLASAQDLVTEYRSLVPDDADPALADDD